MDATIQEVNCKECGIRCKDSRSFKRLRKSFSSSEYVLCLSCVGRNAQKSNANTLLIYLLLAISNAIFLKFDPGEGPLWAVFKFTVLYLFFVPAIALHELGHAAVAWLVRWKVLKVQVGWFGKPIFQKTAFGIDWQWNSIPLGGMAYVYPQKTSWFPLKAAAVLFAGPGVNLLMAWFCFGPLDANVHMLEPGFDLLGLFGLANLLGGAINLVPAKAKYFSIPVDTDGRAILRAFFDSKTLYKELQMGCCLMECQKLRSSKKYQEAKHLVDELIAVYPGEFALLNLRAIVHLDQNEFQEARKLFLQLREITPQTLHEEALIANNIAWTDLMIGSEELIPEALECSEKAMSVFGALAATQGTRGATLVFGGQIEERLKLLKSAIEIKQSNDLEQALTSCWVAIGEYKLGHNGEADAWLQRIKELDPECPLLPRVLEAKKDKLSPNLC
ncbi:MAG: site-2 protease family protein [Verrucomicrobiales bacterium]